MRLPRLGEGRVVAAVGCALVIVCAVGCSGGQQGYYAPCDEPAGLVVGCDQIDPDELTVWDACMKLARCGVILARGETPGDPDNEPESFDACVAEVEDSQESQGDLVLICIAETACPDLAAVDPDEVPDNADPNPSRPSIEGVIGFCGRLDPS